MTEKLELTPWMEVIKDNNLGVGKAGWNIITKDGGLFTVKGTVYTISKRDLTTLIKSMVDMFSRGKLNKTQVVENVLPIYFMEGIEQNHPDVYTNLYDHLTGWDFKGGAAKVPRVEGGADKGVDFLVTTLRDFAPVMSTEELKAGLRTLVNDDFKMEVATTKLKALLEKNGRDGINKDQFIMLRAKNTEGRKK